MAQIYQGLFIKQCFDLSPDTRQLVKDRLQPHVDEYVDLLKNEMVANSNNAVIKQVHHYVSKWTDSDWSQNYVSESGLTADLFLQADDRFRKTFRVDDRKGINESVAIVLLTRKNFCREPSILTGDTRFQLEMMRRSNMLPIAIDSERYTNLNEAEREQYIFNQILYGLDDSSDERA